MPGTQNCTTLVALPLWRVRRKTRASFTSIRRFGWLGNSRRSPMSSAPRRAWRDSGASKEGGQRRANCSSRSTPGSPRASIPPISGKQRHSSPSWPEVTRSRCEEQAQYIDQFGPPEGLLQDRRLRHAMEPDGVLSQPQQVIAATSGQNHLSRNRRQQNLIQYVDAILFRHEDVQDDDLRTERDEPIESVLRIIHLHCAN